MGYYPKPKVKSAAEKAAEAEKAARLKEDKQYGIKFSDYGLIRRRPAQFGGGGKVEDIYHDVRDSYISNAQIRKTQSEKTATEASAKNERSLLRGGRSRGTAPGQRTASLLSLLGNSSKRYGGI